MKIVLFHPVLLPPRDYGGVERVVLWLAQGLRDAGHQVSVACLEGSRLPSGIELISMSSGAVSAADLVPKLPSGVDLVHFQAPPEAEFFQLTRVPTVTTIHGNGKPGETFPDQSVFLSHDHANRHFRKTFVYNGADPKEFFMKEKTGDARPLFLSKTTLKTKNLAAALDIAKAAHTRLRIAGGRRPFGLRARAWVGGHQWIGPVSGEVKAKVLAESSALFFPVAWPEPFGLVMIEAMLSGVPVLGSAIGSIPEVLEGGGGKAVNGFFWDATDAATRESGIAQWVDAYTEVRTLDRTSLRALAIQRFSHHRMAEDYVQIYQRVLRGEQL